MSVLDFPGAHATDTRPSRKSAGRKAWAKDPSLPGADNGTRLDATFINDLVGMLRALFTATEIAVAAGDDSALTLAITELIAQHTFSVGDLRDGGGFVRMTEVERAKLAALIANYKGSFADLEAVETAYPEAEGGDWAVIMLTGEPASIAVWDTDTEEWVDVDGAPPATAATTPFTPAGNIAATNVQAALQELDNEKATLSHTHSIANITSLQTSLDAKAPTSRSIGVAGLATGGGTLAADRTITVPKAAAADLQGGTNDTNALTAKAVFDAMAEVQLTYGATVTPNFAQGCDFRLTMTGSPTIANPTNAVPGMRGRIRLIQNATGGWAPSYGTAWKFAGGTAPSGSTGANEEDFLDYEVVTSTRIRAALTKGVPT